MTKWVIILLLISCNGKLPEPSSLPQQPGTVVHDTIYIIDTFVKTEVVRLSKKMEQTVEKVEQNTVSIEKNIPVLGSKLSVISNSATEITKINKSLTRLQDTVAKYQKLYNDLPYIKIIGPGVQQKKIKDSVVYTIK